MIGVTLNAMNKGLEEFRATDRAYDISMPHSGVQIQQQHFNRAQVSRDPCGQEPVSR